MSILERWQLTPDELDEIIAANPSLRGFMLGYVGEYKLRKLWFSDSRIARLVKYDNHDRTSKGDMTITYRGEEISVEVKSLQSRSIRQTDSGYIGRFQCDASDRRGVVLPNAERLETTCLVVGEFDLLAVNLFEFRQEWCFAFAKNMDLPRSRYRGYSPEQRKHLIATLIEVQWPLTHPFEAEPFRLLDEIIHEKRR